MANENVSINIEQGGAVINMGGIKWTWDGTDLVITGLPTANPTKAGALWSNAGVLTVSAG